MTIVSNWSSQDPLWRPCKTDDNFPCSTEKEWAMYTAELFFWMNQFIQSQRDSEIPTVKICKEGLVWSLRPWNIVLFSVWARTEFCVIVCNAMFASQMVLIVHNGGMGLSLEYRYETRNPWLRIYQLWFGALTMLLVLRDTKTNSKVFSHSLRNP